MKVFGIGLHKTGTTTLAECFRILGYRVCPEGLAYAFVPNVAAKDYQHCLMLAKEYDAFADSPWNFPDAYRIFDVVFPTAKFILTVRDESRWFRSFLRWSALDNIAHAPAVLGTLGVQVGIETRQTVCEAYQKHNKSVVEYFRSAGDERLLVVDWEQGDGWEKLCAFLGRPVPKLAFPHMLKYDAAVGRYVDIKPGASP